MVPRHARSLGIQERLLKKGNYRAVLGFRDDPSGTRLFGGQGGQDYNNVDK